MPEQRQARQGKAEQGKARGRVERGEAGCLDEFAPRSLKDFGHGWKEASGCSTNQISATITEGVGEHVEGRVYTGREHKDT